MKMKKLAATHEATFDTVVEHLLNDAHPITAVEKKKSDNVNNNAETKDDMKEEQEEQTQEAAAADWDVLA